MNTNLFFADFPFKVQRTSYLYLVTSRDGGRSWSDPVLLPLKKNTERAYLAAPARGIVTEQGEIVYPCYSYDGSANTQRMSFIYSKDGIHWERSTDAPVTGSVGWHSESAAVELSDGRLRFFFRTETSRLTYIDYVPGTEGVADGSIGILYEFREADWGYGEGKYYEMRYETYEVENMEFDPKVIP